MSNQLGPLLGVVATDVVPPGGINAGPTCEVGCVVDPILTPDIEGGTEISVVGDGAVGLLVSLGILLLYDAGFCVDGMVVTVGDITGGGGAG